MRTWGLIVLLAVGCATTYTAPTDAVDRGEGAEDGGDVAVDGDDAWCSAPRTACGSACVDTSDDSEHCGGCWQPCRPTHGSGACIAGVCVVTCEAGWVDVNGSVVDGCEYPCVATAAAEVRGGSCSNGQDDDCDTRVDATDPDCADCVPELCNARDDDCDGLTDEDYDVDIDAVNCGRCGNLCPPRANAGAMCVLGDCDIVCAPGWRDADGIIADGCEASCTATGATETACDGEDGDCDGRTDEDFVPTRECGLGLCAREEVCVRGATACVPRTPPTATDATCDGLDDDCDGTSDEDGDCRCATAADCDDANTCTIETCGADLLCRVEAAADGTPCPGGTCCGRRCVGAGSEICNGVDDDCDRLVDEDFTCAAGTVVGCTTSCGTASTGNCTASCAVPAADACPRPPEACNGQDDDCDTACDEDFECCVGNVESCVTPTGAAGSRGCSAGCTRGPCVAASDLCNGLDDDGDTACDEDFACCRGAVDTRPCPCGGAELRTCAADCSWGPWSGCPPAPCVPGTSESCVTTCGSVGRRQCTPGCTWDTCVPPPETCNARDDDCDGSTDEDFCPMGGTWNATGRRCEAALATTYVCGSTGGTYGDAGSCNAVCTQSGTCSPAPATFGGSAAVSDASCCSTPLLDVAFAGSGTNLDVTFTYQCTWMDSYGSCYGGTPRTSTRRLTVAGATTGGNASIADAGCCSTPVTNVALAGSGANLDVTFTYQCTWMDSYGSCYGGTLRTSTRRLTLSGATISGSAAVSDAGCCSTPLTNVAFAGSGANLDVTFTYQCTWMDSYGSCYGGVTRTSTGRLTLASTSNICPLGSYACGGTPSTCTAPLACTDRLSCPSGYAVFGSLCTASPSCG